MLGGVVGGVVVVVLSGAAVVVVGVVPAVVATFLRGVARVGGVVEVAVVVLEGLI